MICEEIGIRIYSEAYCCELIRDRWSKCGVILPWILVSSGFEKALARLYLDGVFVVKLLGEVNISAAAKTFVLQDRDLGLALTLSPTQTGVSITPGSGQIKLLKQGSTRHRFKSVCEQLGFGWEQVAAPLNNLLEKLYDEQLIMLEADQANADALRAALEDDEAVDLKIRFRAPEDAPAPQPQAQPQQKEPAP